MRKVLFALFLLLGLSSINAQVKNYSLKFNPQGFVTLGDLPALNNLSSFTIQFWMCPTEWQKGTTLLNRGDSFSIALGNEGQLTVAIGASEVTVSSPRLTSQVWNHITILNGDGQFAVRINNEEVYTYSNSYIIPNEEVHCILGGNYSGRLDELRIWKTVLSSDYNYMWQNTLNQYHPQWNDLVAYYKFDQDLCENIVDYTYQNHGTMTTTGVIREVVADNDSFRYFIAGAYSDFSRFADRAIDREKYLLANTLIVLGINSNSDGRAYAAYPYNEGIVSNGSYLAEYQGRKGVLALNGSGAKMEVGIDALTPTAGYTFETWLYLEEWTEGAYILRKELSDTKGFSIRLGDASSRQVIVRIDGREYIRDKKLNVGHWVHIGITTTTSQYANQLFLFSFDGVGSYPSSGNFPTAGGSYLLSGLENVPTIIGENLHAKLDDTAIWNTARSAANIVSDMKEMPMPGLSKVLEASILHSMDSYWAYDKEDNLGYDSYSHKHFINIMRSAYDGYRGYHIKMSVSGHTGWENTFADAAKRETLGKDIARIANENDIDGVDLDFEWTYNDTGWLNYAKICKIIRENLNEGKLLTVTPHKVSYRFPTDYMQYIDYFLFQIYGPNDRSIFTRNGYQDSYNLFINWGYPKEKIVMSYATTTSAGMDANGNVIKNGSANQYPPVGIRNLFDDSYTPDIDCIYQSSTNSFRYITGYDQVVWRSDFIRENKNLGIFYWDMGNDVSTSHEYSLPKASNFSLSANVDSIVTKVDKAPSITSTGITSLSSANSVKLIIAPNPVRDILYFEIGNEDSINHEVIIFNASGTRVLNEKINKKEIDVRNLYKGVYTLCVQTADNQIVSGSFVKL